MVICFFGDSLVNGVGDPAGLGWAGRLANHVRGLGADLTSYNLGVRRHSSRAIGARWQAEAACRGRDGAEPHLFFAFGTVDACLDEAVNLDQAESLGNAQRILETAKAAHRVLMMGPPPMGDPAFNAKVKSLNAALKELCAGIGVSFLDVFTPLDASPEYKQDLAAGDNVHPGAAGYEAVFALARDWAPWRSWFAS